MRSQIVLIIALAVSLLSGVHSFAQSSGPPEPNPDRTPGPPIDAGMPLDDNILILLMAGIILGVYYIYCLKASKKKAA